MAAGKPVPRGEAVPSRPPVLRRGVWKSTGRSSVRRCLDGDSTAWAELVKAQHRRVYSLCYRFTGSSHDAEDLTQEVFLKVYGNLASFDLSRGSFPTWLTTLTRNLLVDHFRRGRQQRATDSLDADGKIRASCRSPTASRTTSRALTSTRRPARSSAWCNRRLQRFHRNCGKRLSCETCRTLTTKRLPRYFAYPRAP